MTTSVLLAALAALADAHGLLSSANDATALASALALQQARSRKPARRRVSQQEGM